MTTKFKLYGYWRSGCSWRVRIALELKGIDYEYIAVSLLPLVGNTTERLPENYIEKNNMEQVPTLEIIENDDNNNIIRLTQSLAIIEYLDENYPNKSGVSSIIGKDSLTRFKSRELAELINSGVQPLQNLAIQRSVTGFTPVHIPELITDGDRQKITNDGKGAAKYYVLKGLLAFETLLEKNQPTDSTFCLGDDVTLADLCLVPQIYNARRMTLEIEKYFPRCVAIDAALNELEAFKKAHPSSCPDAK